MPYQKPLLFKLFFPTMFKENIMTTIVQNEKISVLVKKKMQKIRENFTTKCINTSTKQKDDYVDERDPSKKIMFDLIYKFFMNNNVLLSIRILKNSMDENEQYIDLKLERKAGSIFRKALIEKSRPISYEELTDLLSEISAKKLSVKSLLSIINEKCFFNNDIMDYDLDEEDFIEKNISLERNIQQINKILAFSEMLSKEEVSAVSSEKETAEELCLDQEYIQLLEQQKEIEKKIKLKEVNLMERKKISQELDWLKNIVGNTTSKISRIQKINNVLKISKVNIFHNQNDILREFNEWLKSFDLSQDSKLNDELKKEIAKLKDYDFYVNS